MRDKKDLVSQPSLNPDMPTAELKLHMGEMTVSEALVARAAIRWANSCAKPVSQPATRKAKWYENQDIVNEVEDYKKSLQQIDGAGVLAVKR